MLTLVLAAMMTTFGEKVTPENDWQDYPKVLKAAHQRVISAAAEAAR